MKECTEDETKKNRVGLGTCNGEGVTIFEDSVIVGVEPYLKEKFPKATVDGKVGRRNKPKN